MNANSHQSYVQARLQARHGQLLSDSEWQALESARDLASYLQQARATHLRRWIEHLPAEVNVHRMERSLRLDWKAYVGEVSSWSTREWQPSIDWMGTLVDLPALLHLARGRYMPQWMRADPDMRRYAVPDAATLTSRLRETPAGGLMTELEPGQAPLGAWLENWRNLLPACDDRSRQMLHKFADIVGTHVVPEADGETSAREGPRTALRIALHRHFRQCAGTMAAAFTHIGLMALCWERLRAGLVMRVLIPSATRRPQWA